MHRNLSLSHSVQSSSRSSCALLFLALLVLYQPQASAEEPLDFNDRIRPILNQHCVACHGGVKQAGGLSFVYGDDASYVVEPGAPDDSILIERVTSDDPDLHMPPADHGKPLSDEEVETLRKWIQQGGQWGEHWAFVAPQPHSSSKRNDPWVQQPMDGFILEAMQQSGLDPEPAATPERWLRRVSLDLIGLPPTPAEREEFLTAVNQAQDAVAVEQAYAAQVDRLLQSPYFGERWASVWLDVIRYADSKGLGLDARRTIWKYRDWVIKAFNLDMPYSDFTLKQIAGDLLPDSTLDDVLATACHRLTQTCEEGGTDDEMFRVEAVVDRVNTTMLAWQGLSFGCVQCHSHPYDPIEHDEYYRVMAFFNNSADCDLGEEFPVLAVPLKDSDSEKAHEYDEESRRLRREDWQEAWERLNTEDLWTSLRDFAAATNNSTKVVTEEVDGITEYQTRGTVAKNTTVTIESSVPTDVEVITAIRFTGLPKDLQQALKDSEWGFVISHFEAELVNGDDVRKLKVAEVFGDEAEMLLDPNLSLNAKSSTGFGAYSRIHYPRSGVFVLEQPVEVKEGDQLRLRLKQNVFALGAFPLVAHRGRIAVTSATEIIDWRASEDRADRQSRLAEIRKKRQAIPSVKIPVMRERDARFARPTHVFDRGNYLTKSDSVTPGTPQFLPEMNADQPSRLDLGQWLASSDNPLTARVFANRVWAQFFGRGLVLTQEDFGSSGQPPSHPRLLDDLASRFMHDMDWKPKSLMREIVLSATYRQSSAVSTEKLKADPQNRMLARGPRHRLPAETIRDQSLAIAGLLSDKQFGEPVHPPIPGGVWLPFQGGDKWKTPEKGDSDRYRRSIYTYTKRSIQFPMMASFDAPTREFCTPRRSPSNTPLQALMTLNDATFVEASEAFAERMLNASEDSLEQLQFGFELAAGRVAKENELEALSTLYRRHMESADKAEDNPDRKKSELQALTAVASVLLNLDEVLNK